jgi:carbonic anhydrase
MGNKAVQEAIRERGLQVHATIYSTATGLLRDLGLGTRGPDVTTIVREVQQVQEVPREIIMGNHGVLDFSSGSANMTVR